MGISPRVHFFDKYGKIEKIPYRKFERLLNGDKNISYPKYAYQKVKCAISYVEMENRYPVNIIHCDYLLIPFDTAGGLDTNCYQYGLRLMHQSFDLLSSLDNIVYIQSIKAQKEYKKNFTWQVSQGYIQAIIDQIFQNK
jgi:hypothetical protein